MAGPPSTGAPAAAGGDRRPGWLRHARRRWLGAEGPLLALLVARTLQLGNGFLISMVLVWVHGVSAAGTYAVGVLPAAAASHLFGLGLASALPRRAIGDGERATIGLLASLATLPLLASCAGAYGLLLGNDPRDAAAIALFAFAGALGGALGVQQSLYVLQERTRWAPLAPALQLAGLGVAALMPSLLGFALALAASRLAGVVLGFAPLRFARCKVPQVRGAVAEGLRFASLDLLGSAGDALAMPFVEANLTRAEIGLYGLARQFVTVADTPGWSFLQTRYPALIADLSGVGPEVARRNERLAWASALASLAAACVVAPLVYGLPELVPLLLVLLVPSSARYLGFFCDQALRADGRVRECVLLGLARVGLSLVVLPGLAALFGLWGLAGGVAGLSLAFALLSRWRLLAHHPRLLPAPRPWKLA